VTSCHTVSTTCSLHEDNDMELSPADFRIWMALCDKIKADKWASLTPSEIREHNRIDKQIDAIKEEDFVQYQNGTQTLSCFV